MKLPVTMFVSALLIVARAPPMFMVIPVDAAIEDSIVMVVELVKTVTCFQTAVIEPVPPENSMMFPTMAAEKFPVLLVMVVVPLATASTVEMLTVALWQLEQAAAFLLSNW